MTYGTGPSSGRRWPLSEAVTLNGHAGHRVAPPPAENLEAVCLLSVDVAPLALTALTPRSSGLVSWVTTATSQLFLLGLDRAGRPCVSLQDGHHQTEVVAGDALRPGHWTRLSVLATGDTVELHVDGRCVGSAGWAGGLPRADDRAVVGMRADSAVVEGVLVEGVLGSAGPVTIESFADAVSARAAVRARAGSPAAPLDVVEELGRMSGTDRHRPAYHFMPPAHWMNEPHGPVEVDGVHHLFYQANRKGPFWGGIEWGHAVSSDLVHWRHLPPALTPAATATAPDGVWSGSSVLDDSGLPLLFFTAGDFTRRPDQSVTRALPAKDEAGRLTWQVDAACRVDMPQDPALDLVPGQFRDPFVWREGDIWFMLVGAGLRGRGGTALLHTSADGRGWRLEGPLLTGDSSEHPEVGEMWELPVLLPVTSASGRVRHVLCVCPWWDTVPRGLVVEVHYWVGTWDPARRTFEPLHPEPRRLDFGRHFTGPSGNVLSDGRTILWSIAQDGRSTQEHLQAGWAHNAGLPLELSLGADDDLRLQPVRELAALRSLPALVDLVDAPVETATVAVARAGGHHLELDVRAQLGAAGCLHLDFACGTSGDAKASVTVDAAAGTVTLRRPGAAAYDQWNPRTSDSGDLQVDPSDVRVRAYVDASMLEVYLDDRRALTTRVYAPEDATGMRLRAPAGTQLRHLRIWRLDPAATPHDPPPS